MKKLLPLIILLLCLMSSCEKAALEDPIIPNDNEVKSNSVNITKSEAEQLAIEAVNGLVGTGTKSSTRKIKSNDVICSAATRSGISSDTLFYVVNFEANEGFAVIAADSRTPQVVAIADDGNFDWQQAENSEASFLTRSLTSYQMNRIGGVSGDIMIDVGSGEILKPGTAIGNEYGPWVIGARKNPMLKTRWGQGDPWNAHIPNGYVAGCTTIAAAQIMAYFKYPESHDGNTFVWEDITDKHSLTTKRFIRMAFDHIPGKFYTFFDKNSVGNDSYNIRYLLTELGYRNYGSFIKRYDYALIEKSLDGGSPVCLGGHVENSKLSNGHNWVADGYYVKRREVRPYSYYINNSSVKLYRPDKNYTETRKYIHYNWGWSGYCDGYYSEGVFDARYGDYDRGGTVNDGGDHDYHGLVDMWINIKRPY